MRTMEEIRADILAGNYKLQSEIPKELLEEWRETSYREASDHEQYLNDLEKFVSGISINRLTELVQADAEGRCVILPEGNIQNDTTLWFVTSDGNIYKTTADRIGNVIWYYKPKRFYLTRESALATEGEKQ